MARDYRHRYRAGLREVHGVYWTRVGEGSAADRRVPDGWTVWISSWQNEVEEVEEASIQTVSVVDDVPETLLDDGDYPAEPSN